MAVSVAKPARRLTGKRQRAPGSAEVTEAGIAKRRAADVAEPCQTTTTRTTARATALPSAIVLNLDRRPDRWRSIAQRLSTTGLSFERTAALDGAVADIPESLVTKEWSTASNRRYVVKVFEGGEQYEACTLTLSDGERGCAASHLQCWRRVADRPAALGPVLVLEDDAEPVKGFQDKLRRALEELRSEPDILYLGYTQAAPWRRKVSKSLREAEYLWTTVAYLLWPSGAQVLLGRLPVDQPVDNFMAKLAVERRLRCFAVVPELVRQASEWNADSDIPHSDESAWRDES
eukprot:CAMPEP_0170572222 /NCGR_PEP_ID=MMETSP0224-20130122/2094_1 /TAXON_ID=285029 /ORGANISM="Togula jolla, Strain CCCM 725" /LENGTH=289 /DNA_ID=CAMNT_0010894683 /DNA_START=617 /DNA_END=1486 /DNA_ORIENTATION=-